MHFLFYASATPAQNVKEKVEEKVGNTVDETVDKTVDKTTDFDFWAFVIGTPLRIAIIIVVAIILNAVVRRIIRRFAHRVAEGATDPDVDNKTVGKSPSNTPEDDIARTRRAQRAHTVASMLSSIATTIICVIGVMMVLTELKFDLAPVLASAGIAGVAIGFGAQTLVKDYLSGFFLVVEDQYGIGDTVDLGEAIGTVEEVGLRTTKVRGVDGTLWHVRNGEILRVGNFSQGWARAVMDIPVPYNSDRETINTVINAAVTEIRKDPQIAKAILEDPEIWGVEALSGESVTIRTVIKTEPNEQWAVARAFRAAVKAELDGRGMRIPLPQQTILRTMPDPESSSKDPEAESATGHKTDS